MKNILLIFVILFLSDCKEKEEPKPCNCGLVVDEGRLDWISCTYVELENYCTRNRKKFCIDESDWFKVFKGDNYCMEDTVRW